MKKLKWVLLQQCWFGSYRGKIIAIVKLFAVEHGHEYRGEYLFEHRASGDLWRHLLQPYMTLDTAKAACLGELRKLR